MGLLISCVAQPVAECLCCLALSAGNKVVDWTFSQVTRLGHILIFITVMALSVILGQYYSKQIRQSAVITSIKAGSSCKGSQNCIYTQLVYRGSFSLACFFVALSLFSICTREMNRKHWILKFFSAACLLVGMLWVKDDVFMLWSEIARVLSFFWLLIQAILMLDLSHGAHEYIMAKADETEGKGQNPVKWYSLYLFLAFICLAGVVTGFTFLFGVFFQCSLGQFFIMTTLISGILTCVLSLLNSISLGILPPAIMFIYSTFLCW